ncbi:response regulator [Cohnella panacarvi]|uniref:response regulator n=1 Tax=Cohnella panacarvi TaxID=400776 RepID=UPI0004798489|nr:response regulator [Cohnella panacarvi]
MVNVVVVDDEERIRQGLAKLISQAGEQFRVTGVFASGFELLEQLDKQEMQADLVITDMKMPNMNGLELIERLKERAPRSRIAIVSGFDDFAFARQALRYGVEEYLLKPVDKGELEQLLRKVDECLALEREKELAMREDQLGLLLFNEAELLPKQLRQEAGKALELSPLFSVPYAVYIIRSNMPESPEEMLESAAEGWLQSWKLMAGDDCYALIVGMNCADHAESAREIGHTLLYRLPPSFEGRIGGSNVFRGASWLREAYRQAELAIQHAWYDSGRRVFADYSRLPKRQHSVTHLLVLLDREFQETMTLSDFARAKEWIARWFRTCKEDAHPWTELREGCEAVLAFIHRYANAKTADTAPRQPRAKACFPQRFPDFGAFSISFLSEVEEQFRVLQESRQENRAIETVKAYIAQHYTEELELNRLAEEVYLTPSYLSKLFKTETGETITDFLISVRIDRAKDMLRDRSALKTYEIGEKVGYADPAYFNKVFKKVVGCTPREYRDRTR